LTNEAKGTMGSMFQAYVDSQAVAREDFGRMLRLWRERNGWTQYTVERWGREAGFRTVSSGNISMVEQGKAGDLRAQAHFQLADVNRRIAEKDWGPVKSQEIRQALAEATAIRGDDGQLWGPTEFWSCYVGLLPVPQTYRRPDSEPMPEVSGDLATELSAQWRQQFTQEASRRGLDPIETLQGVARQAPAAQRKTLRAVLASFRDYEAGELAELWEGEWLPERWIRLWSEGLEPAAGGENDEATRP
jgi:transcriptional regulator with XRE-family HTH domain